jgi:hypothetical protein
MLTSTPVNLGADRGKDHRQFTVVVDLCQRDRSGLRARADERHGRRPK